MTSSSDTYAKLVKRICQLAAKPKSLSLKDLRATAEEAKQLLGQPQAGHTIANAYSALDEEYHRRLETFFPLLLEAARQRMNSPYMINVRELIERIDAPIESAPSFKVGDYVVCFDGPGTDVNGVRQVSNPHPYPSAITLEGAPVHMTYIASRFRLARPDEIRAYLLTEAAKQGFVIGARVEGGQSVGHLTKVATWLPGDTLPREDISNVLVDATKLGKPLAYGMYDTGQRSDPLRVFPVSQLTLAPEPTHYLYRVWLDVDGNVRREARCSGSQADLDTEAHSLNAYDRNQAIGTYKVYSTQMPERQTI